MAGKIASLYAEISADTTKLQSGLKDSKSRLGSFKDSLNDVVQKTTGFSLAQVGAAGAVAGVINEARKAITEWSSYAEAMEKGSAAAGVAVDEYSRLIQAGDDLRVSQEQMQAALEMATKNGFQVTTASLADLADEFVAIQSPTERAAKMQKIFGRQWADMVPLLKNGGKAIRDAAGEIDDSLIVTQKAVEANKEYMKAMDDLSDAWTGVKNEAAQGLIPALSDLITVGLDLQRSAEAPLPAWAKQEMGLKELGILYNVLTGAGEDLTETQEGAAPAVEDLSDRLLEQANAVSEAAENTVEYKSAISDATDAFDELTERMLYNALAANMDKDAALSLAWQMGLLNADTYKTLTAVDELTAKYDTNGEAGIQAAEMTAEYRAEVERLQSAIDGLPDNKLVKIGVEINYSGLGSNGLEELYNFDPMGGESTIQKELTLNRDLNGNGIIGAKNGLDMRVPAGFPNDSLFLPLAVSSGEQVTVTPAGQDAGGVTVHVTQYISTPVDARSMAYDIAAAIRAGR